ncbi:MAG: 50S ribosomal protein L27 [Candidatus Shikimatogenerans bostrichidophilus]|nr:MAG: 50S ribosomal protein L27 [Candidatus Shikimatogenerans bostrichidophilus]
MAHKKGVGSTKNGRDSIGKRLGIKKFNGTFIKPGQILVRQRGKTINIGLNTYISKDYTIHSRIYGVVKYIKCKNKTFVSIMPINYKKYEQKNYGRNSK